MSELDPNAAWQQPLLAHFPAHSADEAARLWKVVQQSLAVDQDVTGIVIAKAPFGAWVDIGVGFPALLEIIHIEGMTPERYAAGDWCPVGSELAAKIRVFGDNVHQIGLRQKKS